MNLIITGVGGQGGVLSSKLLGKAAMMSGFEVTIGETYGASQRGGSVVSHIRISELEEHGPLIPEGSADVVVGFEPVETLKVLEEYGNPKVKVLTDVRPNYPVTVLSGEEEYPEVDDVIEIIEELCAELKIVEATELAESLGAPIVRNILMVGSLTGMNWVPIEKETFEGAIEDMFSEDKVKLNIKAFTKGFGFVKE